ncbi:MAG: glycosyltransferase family 4 protein [Planctomycetota bacterium]|nr:glycosyltransferase family 4 protein [Planctomycetota bacterium]
MTRLPALRVLTASWPGLREPSRARFIRDLHLELATDFDTEVVAPRIHDEDPLDQSDGPLRVRRFRYHSGGKAPRQGEMGLLAKYSWVRGLQRAARHWKPLSQPSVILTHWAVPAAAVARRNARRLRCPYVVWCHGSDIHRFGRTAMGKILLKFGLSSADRVLAASDEMARELHDDHGIDGVQVLPVGIDSDFIETPQAAFPEFPLRLLWVGERLASKGYLRVLEAVREAGHRGVPLSLEVIGSGPLERLDESPSILLRGDQPISEVRAAMDRSHLLLLPSDSEGTPLVIQESIARHLPVAATPVGGIPALFSGNEGWFSLQGDGDEEIRESLTCLLVDLSDDSEALNRAKKQLGKQDTDRFSRRRCGESIKAALLEVMR